jgi:hypothetical protein
MADPLADSRIGRTLTPEPDRPWLPIDVVRRAIDDLAAAAVQRTSEARTDARRRPRTPIELEKLIELVEDSPIAGRSAAVFRQALVDNLVRWRVRARWGKVYYWDETGT